MDSGRPDETPDEQADRNFVDLLQELRVTQTGVQVLFAFLLTIPLQARFGTLDGWQRHVLVVTTVLCALSIICLVAPVAFHRMLFRRHVKRWVVEAGSPLALLGLGFLGLAVVAAVELVLDLVIGRAAALVIAAVLAVLVLGLWVVAPLVLRERAERVSRGDGRDG